MSIKVVLFDLDGTLLPMDQDVFIKTYFGMLTEEMVKRGYDRKLFSGALLDGIDGMMKNSGKITNEQMFWEIFCSVLGEENGKAAYPYLDSFYENVFDNVSRSCGYDPSAKKVIDEIKQMGFRVALATNPVFPLVATGKRIKWAGISPDDFELITSYENSHYSKPSLDYYREVAESLGVSPSECIMIGNDVSDDMVAIELGMKTFLLTDCLINKENKPLSDYDHGSFDVLLDHLRTLK